MHSGKLSKIPIFCSERGNIFLIFSIKEAQEKLNLSDKTVTKAFKHLSEIKLIYKKKHTQILEDNINFKFKCVKLKEALENKERKVKQQFEYKTYKIEHQYQKIIRYFIWYFRIKYRRK